MKIKITTKLKILETVFIRLLLLTVWTLVISTSKCLFYELSEPMEWILINSTLNLMA